VKRSDGFCLPSAAALLAAVPLLVVAAEAPAPPQGGEGGGFDGEKLFATSCGWCHQSGGRVAGRGPKLAGTDKSDAFIVTRIKTGKAPGMPAFGRSFSDEQLAAIIAYIRSLRDEP
jgi:mono/diheme cytochrome c family protein